jgi:hypothetical protein
MDAIVCGSATLSGTTGLDSGRIDLTPVFDDCFMQGVGPATVDCTGDLTL